MALSIGKRVEDGIAILDLEGALTLGPLLSSVRNAAREALGTSGVEGIVLNVRRVVSVDSSGLGELTIVYSSANRRGCPMLLTGVSTSLRKMLQMTHLDAVLESEDDLTAAKKKLKER